MNRNKLIEVFISNVSNAILHEILERAIDMPEIAQKYNKEIKNSFDIAKRYREKINPINVPLPEKDVDYIKNKIRRKVNAELSLRISRGYKNINVNLVEELIDKFLKVSKVI
jgi:hypothetical protein